jgi:hypothetical protein
MQDVGQLLTQYFRDCAEAEEIVEYEAIAEILGETITKGRRKIYAAMRQVLLDHGRSFAVVRSVGYRPLSRNVSISTIGDKSRGTIDRTVKKWGRHMGAIDTAKLDQVGLDNYIRESCRLQVAETIVSAAVERQTMATLDRIQETYDDPLSPKNMRAMLRDCQKALAGVG